MLVLEAKLKGKEVQYGLIEEAIRTTLLCRNKALRYWMDNEKVSGYDLNKQMTVLAKEFDFANQLGSQARPSSALTDGFKIDRLIRAIYSGNSHWNAVARSQILTLTTH